MHKQLTGVTLSLLLFLSACSQTNVPQALTTPEFSHITTITINMQDTTEGIEAMHNGSVVVWRPEAGFAVLGLNRDSETLMPLSASETNQNVVKTPEAQAGGWQLWAGGWQLWAGGWQLWAGGQGNSFTPTENHTIWKQIGLFDAHDLARNLGAGVKVAVIDTGIDVAHPIFFKRLAPEAEWFDFVDRDTLPQEKVGDAYGHGTGVAGIIRQVAPNATILPIRALRADGSGDLSAVLAAMDHAISQGAHIINLSLGTDKHTTSLRSMMDFAASRGVYVIASSGNTGDNKVTFPAAYAVDPQQRGVMSLGVGSIELDNTRSGFSTFGHKLELLAPGRTIYTSAPDEQLAAWTGTSMSAAVVTGALALALGQGVNDGMLAEEIGGTAAPVVVTSTERRNGKGQLDVAAFLTLVLTRD